MSVTAIPGAGPPTDDEARKRAIARALWSEVHWLMPADRAVAIAIDGDDIAVAFGPLRASGRPVPVSAGR